VYLTVEDVARLAAESGQHRALVLTLAYTGIRWARRSGCGSMMCSSYAAE
jgi:hypothetical protein